MWALLIIMIIVIIITVPPAPSGEGGPHDAFNKSVVKIKEEAEDEGRQTINFNNTLVFTLPMFKSDRVTHKKAIYSIWSENSLAQHLAGNIKCMTS